MHALPAELDESRAGIITHVWCLKSNVRWHHDATATVQSPEVYKRGSACSHSDRKQPITHFLLLCDTNFQISIGQEAMAESSLSSEIS